MILNLYSLIVTAHGRQYKYSPVTFYACSKVYVKRTLPLQNTGKLQLPMAPQKMPPQRTGTVFQACFSFPKQAAFLEKSWNPSILRLRTGRCRRTAPQLLEEDEATASFEESWRFNATTVEFLPIDVNSSTISNYL